MSDKKILDMDDLMVDNLSLDSLTSLPNTADAANDWKHKNEPAVDAANTVADLDVSAVDFSVLDPERETSESTYSGNNYFTPAPEEEENPAPAAFTPPTGGITVEKAKPFVRPTGGIEVGKVGETAAAAPVAPVSQPAAYTPPKPAPINLDDPLSGLGIELPPLKKVSIAGELPPIKSIEVPSAPSPELPPLKPVSAETAAPKAVEVAELPPLKPVSAEKTAPKPVEVPELPPLKPATAATAAPKAVEVPDLPPLKPVTAEKTAPKPVEVPSSELPPLKPVTVEKTDSGLPPMKPVTVGKKSEEQPSHAEEDPDFVRHSDHNDEAPLPSDMSDVVAPKLDEMMQVSGKKADFEDPANKVGNMDNPFTNTNMSAARRRKLEEGFDAPIVMQKPDAAAIREMRNQEEMERAEKGKTDVLAISIIYIVLCSAVLVGNISTRSVISFAIDVLFGVGLYKRFRGVRIWYIVTGLGSSFLALGGVGILIAAAKAAEEITGLQVLDTMTWIMLISAVLQCIYLIVTSIMLFANKNIRAYFNQG